MRGLAEGSQVEVAKQSFVSDKFSVSITGLVWSLPRFKPGANLAAQGSRCQPKPLDTSKVKGQGLEMTDGTAASDGHSSSPLETEDQLV